MVFMSFFISPYLTFPQWPRLLVAYIMIVIIKKFAQG
jgi:hypothetical protein